MNLKVLLGKMKVKYSVKKVKTIYHCSRNVKPLEGIKASLFSSCEILNLKKQTFSFTLQIH